MKLKYLTLPFLAALYAIFSNTKTIVENSEKIVEKPTFKSYDTLYIKYGGKYGVEPSLLKALAIVESNENHLAVNPSDPSHGLMQILCIAENEGDFCKNRLYVEGWETATPEKLLNPDFNVMIGSQIISWNIMKYGLEKGIALYNAWNEHNREAPINGPFTNQDYVDKVYAEYIYIRDSQNL